MKFTNTEVEDLIEKILFIIDDCEKGYKDEYKALKQIKNMCKKFNEEYCCPYEKYTAEWYDEHGE